MTLNIRYDAQHGRRTLYEASLVYHCNYYNLSLQNHLMSVSGIDWEKVLVQAAKETAYLQFRDIFERSPNLSVRHKIGLIAEHFQLCGFGLLDLSLCNETGGTVLEPFSHYGLAARLQRGSDRAEYFDLGYLLGAFSAAFGKNFTGLAGSSIGRGDPNCSYQINSSGDMKWAESLKPQPLPQFVPIPKRPLSTSVDENKIVSVVNTLPLVGNDQGLIPAFNVYLSNMYGDYYAKLNYTCERALFKKLGNHDAASYLLQDSGHICGFYTMGGIMTSPEWKALVLPMIRTKEDWLHGIVAAINALGWGVWRIQSFEPGKKVVIRVYEGYESLGYLRWFGKSDHFVEHTAVGVATMLLDLIYVIDVTRGPQLDAELFEKTLAADDGFSSLPSKCLASGDDYSEFTVYR